MMSARGGGPPSAMALRKPSVAVASAAAASSPSAVPSAVKAPASLPLIGSRTPAAAQPMPVRSTQLPPMSVSVADSAPHDAAHAEPAPSAPSSVAAALAAAAPAASALPGVLSVSDDDHASTSPVHEILTPVANRQASAGPVTAIPFVHMSPGKANWPPRLNPQLLQQQSQSQLMDDDDEEDLPAMQPPPTTHASAAKDR